MDRLRTFALAVLVASPLSACTDAPSSEGAATTARFGLTATNGGRPTPLPATANGGIVVESAWFWADEVTLVGDRGRAHDLVIEDQTLELSAGMRLSFPSVPPGLYSRAVVDLEPPDADDQGAPAERELRASYRITGRTAEGTPFTIRDRTDLLLDVRAGDGVDLNPGQMLEVVLQLDVGAWWDGVVLGAPSAQGEILVDGGPTLVRFRENLLRSASLVLTADRAPANAP